MPPRRKIPGQVTLPGIPTMADLRDTLWKAALLGGIATASLHTLLDVRPLSGRWPVAAVGAGPRPASDPGRSPGAGNATAGLSDPGV